jgi:hypothetical protein
MKLRRQAGVRMNVMWKAACVAALAAATFIEIGCGNSFRTISTPLPVSTGNPSGAETEVVLNQCPSGSVCSNPTTKSSSASVLTLIDVSGDSNMGNWPLQNQVGITAGPAAGSMASPMAFDFSRSSVFTANTATDTVTQLLVGSSTAGFAANTTTISLETGSKPIGMSFEYFGTTYPQDYVVNSGTTASCPTGGSLGEITQATALLKTTICLGAGANPVAAWIYKDQTKVFVLDFSLSQVYVVSASTVTPSTFQVTNTIKLAPGAGPIKVAQSFIPLANGQIQSNSGQFLYVLNSNGTISIIDGQAETVSQTISTSQATSAAPVDIAPNPNVNDTTANTQSQHVWILHADGTVSVYDGTTPGQLSWITSIATMTTAQVAGNVVHPTNLALLRDGTWAYVGLGNTDQIVGIDTSKLAGPGAVTPGVNACPPAPATCTVFPATTTITVGVHRSVTQTVNNIKETLETTTPTVNSIAVSRQGTSADLSKVYATTTTTTTFNYFDANGNPTSVPALPSWCTTVLCPSVGNATTFPDLYNGTAVVTAAAGAETNTPINRYVLTIPAPSVVTYCNPPTGEFDGQKNCPAMEPVMVLGRS